MFKAPRGTTDILGLEQAYWRYIEDKAIILCQLYGYERVDTPIFEEIGLFLRTIGEGTDIVEKQMYIFKDRGGKLMTLKPEGTAPVCRAYLEHGLFNLPQPLRLFYFAPIFRYERPQAGRYRQHHQFGCEAFGDAHPSLDAEVIELAWQFFLSLGLEDLCLEINSIGCKRCRPSYREHLLQYYSGRVAQICPDCQSRLQRNPLRLLDCKRASCQAVAKDAPHSLDFLCQECREHFQLLERYLELLKVPFHHNHCLVRGLDYYTRTVFEVQPPQGGAQSTLGGGGRYDDLIEELGGKPTPAIGFAAGIERIISNLKKNNIPIPPLPKPKVFVAYIGDRPR
jgi:histidyl-tRNA synthetase